MNFSCWDINNVTMQNVEMKKFLHFALTLTRNVEILYFALMSTQHRHISTFCVDRYESYIEVQTKYISLCSDISRLCNIYFLCHEVMVGVVHGTVICLKWTDRQTDSDKNSTSPRWGDIILSHALIAFLFLHFLICVDINHIEAKCRIFYTFCIGLNAKFGKCKFYTFSTFSVKAKCIKFLHFVL